MTGSTPSKRAEPMSTVSTFRAYDGKSYLCVTAKRSYAIRNGTRAEPVPQTATLVEAPRYIRSSVTNAHRLIEDVDFFAGIKPATDVLLRGTAYSHQGRVPSFQVALRVGPIARTLRVWGDRTIQLGRGAALLASAPVPRDALPLIWDHAYGGRDEHAERTLFKNNPGASTVGMLAYPRNPAGRGFFIDVDRERMEGSAMPSIEDPLDPISPDRLCAPTMRAWIDCPAAACFEPIDQFTFPRAVFFIPPTFDPPKRDLHEARLGVLGLDEILQRMATWDGTVDPRAFNCAPAGLATARLKGNERVELHRLHSRHEALSFELPADRPQMVLEPPGVSPRELEPSLQTVLIEPERDLITLTWAGTLEVAMPYPRDMVETMRHATLWTR
jgi:hypothetical protein